MIKSPLKYWQFYLGESSLEDMRSEDSELPFKEVQIPHDWSAHEPLCEDYSSGTGYAAGGTGWYKHSFMYEDYFHGKEVTLHFEGIYKKSSVYLNGIFLGSFSNGYLPFTYRLTPYLKVNDRNTILIKVDHNDISDSRWYNGSGITRMVHLLVHDPVFIPSYGISAKTQYFDESESIIRITTQIKNELNHDLSVVYTHEVYDENEVKVCEAAENTSLEPCSSKEVSLDISIHHPILWELSHPHLYTIKTSLRFEDTTIQREETITRFGIRSSLFHPDTGYHLNGKSLKLKGVCLHEDGGTLGTAMYKEEWRRRLLLLKEAGVNSIRMSHNPHMEALYDLTDELGFLVIEEAFDEWEHPKNKWHKGHNIYPPKHEGSSDSFLENYERDLSIMIKRGRNHPSIILWSLGNEIDYPNDPYCHPLFKTMTGNNDLNKPREEMIYNSTKPNAEEMIPIARKLADIVHTLDATRPVTFASAFPELSAKIGLLNEFDVVGYNYKEHLFDEGHREFPHIPFLDSENGHESEKWRTVEKSPYIAGQFIWTGIDYLGESRPSWPNHGSSSGLLKTNGSKKAEFYHRATLWSDSPVLRLFTALPGFSPEDFSGFLDQYKYGLGEMIEVRCFTNSASVEIYQNGISLGTHAPSDYGFASLLIPYIPGSLEVFAEYKGKRIQHRLETPDQELKLSATILLRKCDYIVVEITAVDSKNISVKTAQDSIECTLTGGKLLAMDNGNLSDTTVFSSAKRNLHQGHLIAYILQDPRSEHMSIEFHSNTIEGVSLCL